MYIFNNRYPAKSQHQAGYLYIFIIGLLMLVIGGSLIANYFIHHPRIQSGSLSATTGTDPNTNTFSDCLKHGGMLGNVAIPGLGERLQEDTDSDIASIYCKGIGNVTHKPDQWRAADDSSITFDVSCSNSVDCPAIRAILAQLCSATYSQPSTGDPTLMFHPIIYERFARVEITDCSASHS